MLAIEIFDFLYDGGGRTLAGNSPRGFGFRRLPPQDVTVTVTGLSSKATAVSASDPLATELAAYNHAFCELELPWQWDAATLTQLKRIASDCDVVGAYVERSHAHLLRAYEKAFLRDLVQAARERYQQETCGTAS